MDQGEEASDVLELPVASEADLAYRSGLHIRLGDRLGKDRGLAAHIAQEPKRISRREVEIVSGQNPAEEYGFFLALQLVEQFAELRGRQEISEKQERRAIYYILVLRTSRVATREHAYLLESFLTLTIHSIVQSARETIAALEQKFLNLAPKVLQGEKLWPLGSAKLANPFELSLWANAREPRPELFGTWRILAYIGALLPYVTLDEHRLVQSAREMIEGLLMHGFNGCKAPSLQYIVPPRIPPIPEPLPGSNVRMITEVSSLKEVLAYVAWLDGQAAVVRFEHPQLGLVEREFDLNALPIGASAGDQFELRMELDARGKVCGYAPNRGMLIKCEPEAWETLQAPIPPADVNDPEQMRAYKAALAEYASKRTKLQIAAAED